MGLVVVKVVVEMVVVLRLRVVKYTEVRLALSVVAVEAVAVVMSDVIVGMDDDKNMVVAGVVLKKQRYHHTRHIPPNCWLSVVH